MTDDQAFREWVQKQPSCVSGSFSEWVNGEGRNPACHVRRATTSGVGFKAPYSCIPLTHEEHHDQHQFGEAGCLERHLGGTWTPAQAREWFDVQAAKCRLAWESLASVPRCLDNHRPVGAVVVGVAVVECG